MVVWIAFQNLSRNSDFDDFMDVYTTREIAKAHCKEDAALSERQEPVWEDDFHWSKADWYFIHGREVIDHPPR